MKKITFLIIGIFVSGLLFSQTTIFQDNFEPYTVGQGVASQSGDWSTYSGGSSDDALVSIQYAYSPSSSMNVVNSDYMLYLFGDKTTGHYKAEFKMLIINSNGSYLQISHQSTQNSAFILTFEDDNQVHFDNGTNTLSLMPYAHDQWMNIEFDFDLDNDSVFISIDGTSNGFQFSKSMYGDPQSIQLGDIVFYGSNSGNISNSDYFIDDFKYSDMSGAPIDCADEANIYEFTYDGKIYEVVKDQKNWEQAAACAVERGGSLVEINNQAEQDAIYDAIINGANVNTNYATVDCGGGIAYVWIGAADNTTEGTWLWDGDNDAIGINFYTGQGTAGTGDGVVIDNSYVNWGTTGGSEPDNFSYVGSCDNDQDAVGIALASWPHGNAGEWNDIQNNEMLYYVIEYSFAGFNNIDESNDIRIFPNPSNGQFVIEGIDLQRIEIADVTGKIVYLSLQEETMKQSVDLTNTTAGIYFVKITTSKGIKTLKVITY